MAEKLYVEADATYRLMVAEKKRKRKRKKKSD
jgi:hypothetical protein